EQLDLLIPTDYRCGIGIGTINTKFSLNTLEMDGKAFHYSRDAVEYAKENDYHIYIQSENKAFDDIINSLLLLVDTLKSHLTARQKEIILLKRKNLTLQEIGNEKKISKQAVFNILSSANWKQLSIAINTLNEQVVNVMKIFEEKNL
ncbi:MAG: SatD family protein, partial [Candidatus Thorarchaeota archaeon]